MEYKIRDILSSPIMKDSKLVAGERGISNTISDIIVMEAHDIENWLKPNQLILTSLFSLQESSKEKCIDFVKLMCDMEASALIVKIGRFVDELPLGIIEGAEQYNLPIIIIDENIEYRDIILEVMQNVLNRKAKMLDIYQNIQREFKKISIQDGSILTVLETLKRLIKMDISLVNSDREMIESTTKIRDDTIIKGSRKIFKESYMIYEYTRELISYQGELSSRLLIKIELENKKHLYLEIEEEEQFVLMHDYMAIENACNSIQFEYAKELALNKVKQNHMNDLVDQILNSKYQSRQELLDLVHTLKLSNNKSYRVITWMHRPDLTGGKTSFNEREQVLSDNYRLIKKLEVKWPSFAYRIFINRMTFIIEDNFKSDYEFKRYIYDSLNKLTSTNHLSLKVGVSQKCDVSDISRYAHQPLKVIQIAKLKKKDEFVELYEDLGIYRLFFDLNKSHSISGYIRKEILELDKDEEETLRVFLDKNQNYKHTSEILYVHPKTVKYRIDKIKETYAFDFNNSSEMFQLMVELRIKEFTGI